MNKLYYHSIEISEFQIDQKIIFSVPSILQITAPKFPLSRRILQRSFFCCASVNASPAAPFCIRIK